MASRLAAAAESATSEASITRLRADISAHPDTPSVRVELARALVAAKRLPEALEALGPAAPSSDVVLLRAKILLWSRAYAEAEAALSAASPDVRSGFDVTLCLADVLSAEGKWAEADARVNEALVSAPKHPDALALKMRILKALLAETPAEPSDDVRYRAEWAAIEPDQTQRPKRVEALYAAIERYPVERRTEAIAIVEQSWPRDDERETTLIEAERRANLQVAAFRRASTLSNEQPDDAALAATVSDLSCAAAWTLLGKKDAAGARDVASTKLAGAKPTCLLLALAQSDMALSKYDDAGAVYATLRAREPKNPDILLGATQAALSSNGFEVADGCLSALEAMGSTMDGQVAALRLDYYLRSANHALEKYHPKDAEAFARQASALAPTSPDAPLLLAFALQASKKPDQAVKVLVLAVAQHPTSSRLLSALARMPGGHKHVELAKRAVENFTGTSADERFDVALSVGDAYVQENRLTDAATEFLRLSSEEPSRQAPKLRLAGVRMRQGSYMLAIGQMRAALNEERTFDAVLSVADASHALNLEGDAFRLGGESLNLKPEQPDAVGFLDRLRFSHAPAVSLRALDSWDNGTNVAQEAGARISADYSHELRFFGDAYDRQTATRTSNQSATLTAARIGAASQLSARVDVSGAVGTAYLRPSGSSNAVLPLGQALVGFRIAEQHRLAISYEADTFAYTAGMIQDHLGLHSVAATGNGPLVGPLSFYSALTGSVLTDGNARGVAFGSVYSDMIKRPVVKAGINGQVLGFSATTPRSYFSPGRLLNSELFAQVLEDSVDAVILYGGLAAVGIQSINDLAVQPTYRFSAQLGGRPTRTLKILAKGQLTNSANASASVAGFQYYELGAQAELTLY